MRLVFDHFDRQGSWHGLLRYLVHHGIRLPVRPHSGPNRGQLEWHRPHRETLQNLLHHPVYAGSYRHGHRALDPRRKVPGRPGTGRTIHKPEDCLVLLESRCPAVHHAGAFLGQPGAAGAANRARTEAAGAVRQGPSLLGGMPPLRSLRAAADGGLQRLERAACATAAAGRWLDYAEPRCQGLAGRPPG